MRPRHRGTPGTRSQRRIYGRADRPSVDVPLADEWVVGELLMKAMEEDGTWWVRVSYIHPETFEQIEELLPADVVRARS